MADHDQLIAQARLDLTLSGTDGPDDPTLWEHSFRVMVNAEQIAQLPALSSEQIDRDALRAAALYHEAGWAVQVASRQMRRRQVLSRPTSDVQHELAAGMMASSLQGMLPARSLARACDAIRGLNDRRCETIEAHILSDADNLDQMGPLGFLQGLRRDLAMGRELAQVLETWQRQQEYRYWEARIRDGIRFQAVRELAWQRLETMRPFMQALAEHVGAHDVAALIEAPSSERSQPAAKSRGRG